ncbi:restriction endonuclease subunit S [Lentilactobacillus raoultii]|uniref:Restriction endonuclease subunit S n=1 Tax=Lentilactobacillus raoultii TaxID=1987503 RepID=A0ABW3PPC3_9LACO|nr:restriction endonuclease subunit S [Lentilactobacillus raoultii]
MSEENQPKIRFKGFDDPWEQRKLGDVTEGISGNDGRTNLPILTISAGHGWMDQKSRFSQVIAGKELKNYTLLKRGQLSYNHGNSKLAKFGAVFELHAYNEALVPKVYHSFKVNNLSSGTFIDYLFSSKIPDQELRKLVTSGARMDGLLNISKNAFFGIKLNFPVKDEQEKIGSLLSLADNLIAANQSKLEQLKKLKKLLMQKIFSQEWRFKGFNDPWEQRKLGDVVDKVTRKNKNLQSKLPLTISAQFGLVDQRSFFSKQVASKNMKNYFLVRKGEFAYNKSYSNDYPWGTIKRLDLYSEGALSTLYIVFKPLKVVSDFLVAYYDSSFWYKEVSAKATEGARNHGLLNISPQDFFDTKLIIPRSNFEQGKIGNLLKHTNKVIAANQRRLDQLKKVKKYLMQNMFV